MFSNNKIKYWLVVILFIFAGTILLYLRFVYNDGFVHNKQDYVERISPKIQQVIDDPSPQNVQSFMDFLLSIKSKDRSVGEYHLPLYMSFFMWSKYLETGDLIYLDKSRGILEELKLILPEFKTQFDTIINIMMKK